MPSLYYILLFIIHAILLVGSCWVMKQKRSGVAVGLVLGISLHTIANLAQAALDYYFFVYQNLGSADFESYGRLSQVVAAVSFLAHLIFALSFLVFVAGWVKERQRLATLESLVDSLHQERGTCRDQ